MASVSSVTSTSSSSSLYGTRNVLSGLASGLDTESMIENAVSGYNTKITSLEQSRTTVEWEQEAYRSIISKMVAFSSAYCSYTSDTNLLSASFFNNAVTTTANGSNADCVSASGKSSSTIQINGISQLAAAAKYTVASMLGGSASTPTISASEEVQLSGTVETSNIAGTMTFGYGNTSVSISFDDSEVYTSAEDLASAIESKLGEQTMTVGSTAYSGSDVIDVTVDEDGNISFTDKLGAGNTVVIQSASSNIQSTLGFTAGSATSFQVTEDTALSSTEELEDLLDSATMKFTFNGTTKTISAPTSDEIAEYMEENEDATEGDAFVALLQDKLDSAFGSGKITAANTAENGGLKLQFTTSSGSTLKITSSIGDSLGIGTTATSYLDTSTTLGSLGVLDGLTANDDGTYDFVINGVTVGSYTADTALETVMAAVNANTEAGVKVSYSKTTNKFVFTATETGEAGNIEMGEGLAQALFGSTTNEDGSYVSGYTEGQDAILNATVNGEQLTLTRSSNAVEIDGMTITLNDTFGYDSSGNLSSTETPITFTTTSDADTIVAAIKSMIEDYNEMAQEIHDAYTTMPAEKSDGSKYEPLTDEDKEDMTDSAIEAYEEKAKQGLLMGDSDLSSLYSKLLSAITPTGSDGTALRSIGITTSYSDGLTTLELDEDTLRSALSTNPDSVKSVFTKTTDSGSSTNGLMTKLKTQLDNYASVTGATKGILVQKAGANESSLSQLDNSLLDKLDSIDEQIEKWQDKLSDKIDYYTNKFTQLETLLNELNSQSEALASLLGS